MPLAFAHLSPLSGLSLRKLTMPTALRRMRALQLLLYNMEVMKRQPHPEIIDVGVEIFIVDDRDRARNMPSPSAQNGPFNEKRE